MTPYLLTTTIPIFSHYIYLHKKKFQELQITFIKDIGYNSSKQSH